MKTLAMMALAALPMTAQTQKEFETPFPIVSVYIRRDVVDPDLMPARAAKIASGMFAKAGVRIQWHISGPTPHLAEHPVIVDIASWTPGTLHPGALAYAQALEGIHIRIFWDRIKNPANPGLCTPLLAHVMVHEITHILQGANHHSQAGIMKARWTDDEFFQMRSRPLPFDAEDVRLIHKGLASRNRLVQRLLIANAMVHDTVPTR
jgi:hypothetical protein